MTTLKQTSAPSTAPRFIVDVFYVSVDTTGAEDAAVVQAKVKMIHDAGSDAIILACPANELIQREPIYNEVAVCYPLYFPRNGK